MLSYANIDVNDNENMATASNITANFSLEDIPEYTDEIFIRLNNNKPYFDETDLSTEAFEEYSDLDDYGRCGIAYANICKEIIPKEGQERESISRIKPTGWQQTKINGEYLYNRCHLIAYQLANGEGVCFNVYIYNVQPGIEIDYATGKVK